MTGKEQKEKERLQFLVDTMRATLDKLLLEQERMKHPGYVAPPPFDQYPEREIVDMIILCQRRIERLIEMIEELQKECL